MPLSAGQLKDELIAQMYKKKSLSTNADGTTIDIEKHMGDFLDTLSTAIINHIKVNAVVDKDSGTVS
jgi:hypothetical protein